MVYVSNQELNLLQQERHRLIREFDKKFITVEEYNVKLKDVEQRINEKTRLLLEDENKKRIEEEKMAEEQNVNVKKEIKQKEKGKVKAESCASFIVKTLGLKSVKDVTTAVDKVMAAFPNRDRKKVEVQVKSIIRMTKQQKKPWNKYTWDDANFQLTEKPQ